MIVAQNCHHFDELISVELQTIEAKPIYVNPWHCESTQKLPLSAKIRSVTVGTNAKLRTTLIPDANF